jgi:transketolase
MAISDAKQRCYDYRKRILEISQTISALHIAPTFSCLEIVDAIYYEVMRKNEDGKGFRDTFILSKGHGAPAQYCVLERLGIIEKKQLSILCSAEGTLGSHPDYGTPGIAASTGSLGHGLTLGMGMALAENEMKTGNHIYVTISDGELQEGSTWEAIMLAPSLKAINMTVCVDLNDYQSFGRMSEAHPNMYPLVEKFEAFGWDAVEVDGHDCEQLTKALKRDTNGKPRAVIAKTIKGKGVSFMENTPIWHFRSPNPEEYKIAMNDLDKVLNQ